jgi:hypothetical protein
MRGRKTTQAVQNLTQEISSAKIGDPMKTYDLEAFYKEEWICIPGGDDLSRFSINIYNGAWVREQHPNGVEGNSEEVSKEYHWRSNDSVAMVSKERTITQY